ncbi:hypothetical protein CRM22_008215 [Opisthorchis felineus]|uniref:LIM zinc-binding domain-containing protein n=1 Tax=Opisthorchis felineus TaxID=147828 RepID=A0A4S2LCM7_OPIFE|nr:hypothetical protein CRM22_008215 [Opisthorchis felineus]
MHAVTTPRKARNKSKKNKPSASVVDMQALAGEDRAELRRSRSQSRRRRLFEAVAARVDLRRSRSRSKGRSKPSTLEISGPIIQPRVVSEVFGQSPILYAPGPANLNTGASETTRQPQIPTGVSLRSSVQRTSPVDRGQKAQSWDSSWDSTEAFRANGPQDPVHHPLPPEVPVTRQFKAPDHRDDTTILQLLQNAEQSNERFCDVCYKPVNTEERYHLIGRVLHRGCFTCSRCTAPLANQSAICQNGIWSCAHHVQYQLNSIDPPFPEQ